MVIPSFCVIKQCYDGNNHRMAANYMVKSFITLAHGGELKYHGNLPLYFNPRKSKVKITAVNYHGIFITLAIGVMS